MLLSRQKHCEGLHDPVLHFFCNIRARQLYHRDSWRTGQDVFWTEWCEAVDIPQSLVTSKFPCAVYVSPSQSCIQALILLLHERQVTPLANQHASRSFPLTFRIMRQDNCEGLRSAVLHFSCNVHVSSESLLSRTEQNDTKGKQQGDGNIDEEQ
jgi:hypothetical protein